MIFDTYWFLFFAVLAVGGFHVLSPWPMARRCWLGLGCVIFHYHFAGPAGVVPIIVLMIITYFAALTRRTAACVAAMLICVAALCFYKYMLFFIGAMVGPLSPTFAAFLTHSAVPLIPHNVDGTLAPPLGVSFFVFEFVHYLFEVRRGGKPIRNPLEFLLFAIFFPSLVAGPIKRYTQFIPSLDHAVNSVNPPSAWAEGLARVGLGFCKKIVIADQLTMFIDSRQPHFDLMTRPERWGLLAAIAFRILMDFSGYSDIAIGCALLLGIRLPENFNWPYAARSIQEFWQRWHISLSSWIRDYVYIPLGGSRHGWVRRVLNGLIAFALVGLWHGPAWHFVLWGVYHGAGLGVCAVYAKLPGLGPMLHKIMNKEWVVSWLVTQLFAWLGWLLFFYPTAQAWHMAVGLFN
jgi:alginate O-acetyltransferase complex protein AlgI